MGSIAILGGIFNPVHNGHIHMAKVVARELNIPEIILLPLGNPPHKSCLEDAEHRYNMLRLAAKDMPFLTVSRLEIDRPGTTYTIDTLRELRKLYPNSEMFYIIGEDTLPELVTWREYKAVLETTRFAVVRRVGCEKSLDELVQHYKREYGTEIAVCEERGLPISSSEVREAILGKKDVSTVISSRVWDYIKENRLYGL